MLLSYKNILSSLLILIAFRFEQFKSNCSNFLFIQYQDLNSDTSAFTMFECIEHKNPPLYSLKSTIFSTLLHSMQEFKLGLNPKLETTKNNKYASTLSDFDNIKSKQWPYSLIRLILLQLSRQLKKVFKSFAIFKSL